MRVKKAGILLAVAASMLVSCGKKEAKEEKKNQIVCYDCSVYSSFVFEGTVVTENAVKKELDDEEATELKRVLAESEDMWESCDDDQENSDDDQENRLDEEWFEYELSFDDSDIKYYFSLDLDYMNQYYLMAVRRLPEGKCEWMDIPCDMDEIKELFDKSVKDKSDVADKTGSGPLTEEECIEYAKKCIASYVKMEEASGRKSGFSSTDDPEKYVCYVYDLLNTSDEVAGKAVTVLNPENPGSGFYIAIDKDVKDVESGHPFSYDPENYAPGDWSYEGLELKASFFRKDGFGYTDGHFDYECLLYGEAKFLYVTPAMDPENGEEYRPEFVEDAEKDAEDYFIRVYPDFLKEKDDWTIEIKEKEKYYTVKYMNEKGEKVKSAQISYLLSDGNPCLYIAKFVNLG